MDLYYSNGRTYRYFNGSVQFPFGYGLSYTTFSYGNLQVSPSKDVDACTQITVAFTITNTGNLLNKMRS